METSKLGFEIETCGRCGGSGHYSYCQRHGTTCFGCGGSGRRYTKRGYVAHKLYTESLMVPASSIKVGDKVQMTDVATSGATADSFKEVVQIETKPLKTVVDGVVKIAGESLMIWSVNKRGERHGIQTYPDSKVRKAMTTEEKAPFLKAALDYQATLTKAGTSRKR